MKKLFRLLFVLIISSNLVNAQGLPSANKYGSSATPVYVATNFIGCGQGDTVSAINQAIATASVNGGIVYLPEGKWGIANAYRSGVTYRPLGIIGASNVTLRGAGLGQTILVQDAPPAGATFDTTSLVTNTHWASMITCTNCTNFRIENLSINGTLSRQINHTSNPYTTDAIADSSRVDAIRIVGGTNNSVYNVRIDSIQFYGTNTTGGYQTIIDHIIATTCIMGGVYFTGQSSGSVLSNSFVTNNNCDNVRLRSGNITIINNEISWSKFNPSAIVGGGANFAGLYVENDGGTSPQTVGVNVVGNRIHDNSSYAVDVFNVDTTDWTLTGPSVSIRCNEMYRNANGGVQVQMQWVVVDGNDIFDNGSDSLGIQDPTTYSGWGVVTHGLNSNGLSITNNAFRTTSPPGKQLYGIGMGSVTAIPIFSVHGNTIFGGLDLLNVVTAGLKSTAPYNTYYGNTIMDSNKLLRSDWTTDASGGVHFYNHAPGLSGVASGTLYLEGDNDAQLYGSHAGNNTKAFYIGDIYSGVGAGLGFKIGEYGSGSTIAARTLGFYDFQTAALRGAMNAAGDLYWGTSATTFSFIAHQPTSGTGLNGINGVEINGQSGGSTGAIFQGAFKSTLLAGYTGSGSTIAFWTSNLTAGTGNTIGSASTATGNFGLYGGSTGASATGANMNLLSSSGALRNIGFIGDAASSQTNSSTALSGGVIGLGLNANASANHFGGYFGLQTTPTFARAALIADNGATSDPVFIARVAGTTKWQVDATGNSVSSTGESHGLVDVSATGTYNALGTDYTIQFTGSTATLVYPILNLVNGRHLNLVNNASGSITIPSTKSGNASTITTITTGQRAQVEYDLGITTWIVVSIN